MMPKLRPGQLVIGWSFGESKTGDVVIISHREVEKVKRISRVDGEKLYILGDNPPKSTDSRQFGWVDRRCVIGCVVWPLGL
jgi:type IV secretory pathway protease TraF